MTTLLIAALMVAAPAQASLRAFHPGMTQDEARRVAGCRLKTPPGRHLANTLTCSSFVFGGVKMTLSLSFHDGRLGQLTLFRDGYSESRLRRDAAAILQSLEREFGQLASPELGATAVTAETVFTYLERQRTYSTTSALAVKVNPLREPARFEVTTRVSSARSRAPANDFWDGHAIPVSKPTVAGSPFDLVSHSISVTLRAK